MINNMNNFKDISLSFKPNNILSNIIFYETVNTDLLNKLLITDLLLQDLRYKQIYETEYDMLLNYYSKINMNNKIPVKYIKQKYGRSNPEKSLGLHNIRREVRHTIANEFYIDIDIVNCHPVILHQILTHNNIKCHYLTKYIENRNDYLDIVMKTYNLNRDKAKILFISLLYGGSYKKWLKENNYEIIIEDIQLFNEELWNIGKIITNNNNELNLWVLDKHKDDKIKKFNYNSSIVSYYLQEKEVQILEELYLLSVDKEYIIDNNVVLCADGIMIHKERFNKNILNEFHQIIKSKFDIELTFTTKNMNSNYSLEQLETHIDLLELKEINENIILLNEITINKTINNEILKLHNKKNKLISNKMNILNKEILKRIKNYNIQKNKQEQEYEKLKKKLDKDNEKLEIKQLQIDQSINNKLKKIEDEKIKIIELTNTQDKYYLEQIKNELNIYNEYKLDFESKFFKVEEPILYAYSNNDKLKFYNSKDLIEYCCDKYKELFTEKVENGKYIKIPFINKWRLDENKRKYKRIIFNPDLNDILNNECYNLFTGFKLNDISINKINTKESAFFKLLKHICNGNLEYKYIKEWIAHIINKPYKKTNVAVVLYSKIGGIGKNAIIDGLLKLLNGYTGKIESIDDITNRFNENQCNKLLIYGDEINARAIKVADRLKSIITRTEITLEKKGHDSIVLNDYSNWIFTTNNELAFKIDEGSRRMFMIESTTIRLPKEDFINYYNEINDPIKIQQIFNYFLNYKKNKFDIGISPVPNTNYKLRLEFESVNTTKQYLFKIAINLYDEEISGLDLYESIKEYAKKNFLTVPSMTESGKLAGLIFGEDKKKTSKGILYNLKNIKEKLIKHDSKYYDYIFNN